MTTATDILSDFHQSSGSVSELTHSQRTYLRAYFEDSLYAFCQVVMGYSDLDPNLHGELCTYVESLGLQGRNRLMSQIPRGHLKSSVGTIAHSTWRILKTPDNPIVIINQNESNTSNWLRAIRGTFERSDWIHALWPELLPRGVAYTDQRSKPHSLKWSDSEIEIEGRRMGEPEASISGYGRDSGHTGHHWPVMIIDDILGPKERDSLAEMARADGFVKSHTALMRPAEGGRAYVNCTPWTFADSYTLMLREYGYQLYRRAALELEGRPSLRGQPIFPKLFTRETLLALYEGGPAKRMSFLSQYMCSPIPGEDQAFSESSIRYFQVLRDEEGLPWAIEIEPTSYYPRKSQTTEEMGPRLIRLSQLKVICLLDPAPAEGPDRKREPNARNGYLVEGMDAWGRRFILEAEGLLDRPLAVIHRLFKGARKWGYHRVGIEEVNFSKLYRHWIQSLQESGQTFEDTHLVPIPLKPGRTDKDTRIRDKVNGWDNGNYYLNREGTMDFYEEFTQYPHGATRDLLDAMAYDSVLTRPPTDEEEQMALFGQIRQGRDPVTGY